ncbi:MAG: ATP-binding protein [candidate division WOR-3 bacterium]|nr:AAA family ATPase [candidate division WOR-3 bacterium]MDH7519482.1 ATP-binding protein [bacterium]
MRKNDRMAKETAESKRRPRKDQYQRFRVPIDKLRWTCDPDGLGFKTTDEIKTSREIVGQERAIGALQLGLEIETAGYNIFVTGPPGTGRATTVQKLLEKTRPIKNLTDKCLVNNFQDPDQPRLLVLPAGEGRQLQAEMDELVSYLVKNVPRLFEGEGYQNARQEIVDRFKEQGAARVRDFEKKVASEGFALVQTAPVSRPELAPIVDKQPVSVDVLDRLVEEGKLTEERAREIKARYRELSSELLAIFKEIREFERQAREALANLDREIVTPVLEERINEIRDRHKDHRVDEYLNEVKTAILERLDLFRQRASEEAGRGIDPYLEFRVNVLVDNSGAKTAPVVFETNPTYRNLFGSIERVWDRSGQWRTDFTHIKAGSLLRADGGFLVVNALDLLVEPGVWPNLKRTLRNRQLEIAAYDPFVSLFGTTALKPEPIPLDLKVIMIGDATVYALLAAYDEEFKKVFKVRADFDWVMDRDRSAVQEYAQVIKTLCEKENLKPFDKTGVAKVVEYGARLAGRQGKLSTRFNVIGDILKEANYWAGKAQAKVVTAEFVQQAIEARRHRAKMIEDKLQESIRERVLFIDVKGSVLGQVNGLAVYEMVEHTFAIPVRITAKVGVGSAGVISVEREAELSGPIHDKGLYIIVGYLRNRYAADMPLVFSASITFEQSYGGIDGDSASSTELYALLSELAGLPLRQDLAVTGSVNQKGEVQPIGGVNEKIEGFFDVCRIKGITGTQGVLIPKANIGDLMLREDVVAAVKQGVFHIYAIETIDEGIELLTGVPAGRMDRKGEYPPDSVNGRVKKRLRELAEMFRRFRAEEGGAGSAR